MGLDEEKSQQTDKARDGMGGISTKDLKTATVNKFKDLRKT